MPVAVWVRGSMGVVRFMKELSQKNPAARSSPVGPDL
jgi:hypothetical protein